MGHAVPHTEAEIGAMLDFIGLSSVDELFAAIPEALRMATGLEALPTGLSDYDAADRMACLAAANRPAGAGLICFAGAGAYDHDIPPVVPRLALRSEFVTAYTPYQPEVAQGVLQALFEYQTLVSRLTGMDVANASLYDGASACVEAANVAAVATKRDTLWVSQGVHPHWRQVLDTYAAGSGHTNEVVPLAGGVTQWPPAPGASGDESGDEHADEPAALLVQQPNHLGCLEDLDDAATTARERGALLVVAADPVSAGLLRTPGSAGADIVVGEGQPFGTPLSFGGPYLGLFATRRDMVRRVPGRLVGESVDTEDRRAYVTTLRAREQDIRRERASSNVCTNQTLIAVAFLVQLAWLGTGGLRELALRCARGTRYAREAVLALDGVEPAAAAPVLREFAVHTPVPAEVVVDRMADEGFLAGVPLDGEYGGGLLVAVTERRTRAEIDAYVAALGKVIR